MGSAILRNNDKRPTIPLFKFFVEKCSLSTYYVQRTKSGTVKNDSDIFFFAPRILYYSDGERVNTSIDCLIPSRGCESGERMYSLKML